MLPHLQLEAVHLGRGAFGAQSREQLEDAIQSFLARQIANGWPVWSRYEGSRGKRVTWMRVCFRNEWKSLLRQGAARRRAEARLADVPEDSDEQARRRRLDEQALQSRRMEEGRVESVETLERILRELPQMLSARDAIVFEMDVVRGMAPAAIAGEIGISRNAVDQSLHRIRKAAEDYHRRLSLRPVGGPQPLRPGGRP